MNSQPSPGKMRVTNPRRTSFTGLRFLFVALFLTTLLSGSQSNAGILDFAKSLAYRHPEFLNTALRESLTARCNRYLSLASGIKNSFVMDCFNASTELFKTLDLTSIETDPGQFYPISFHTDLLQMAHDKNVITFLEFFNKNVPDDEIEFLKSKTQEFFADRYPFWKFISVLFQDSTETHLVYLKKIGLDSRSLEILTSANRKFYQALTKIENFSCLTLPDSGPEDTADSKYCPGNTSSESLAEKRKPFENPYHFFVIRYLSQELSKKKFNYGLSAFVAFLFNYTYELFSEEMKLKYVLNDPTSYAEKGTEDVISGLAGAYYLDDTYSQEDELRSALVHSPPQLLLELAQLVMPNKRQKSRSRHAS